MASPFKIIPGKIFVGGIAPITIQEKMHKYFAQFGELSDCVIMHDKNTGKSRGFGFVIYKDPKTCDEVLKKRHYVDAKELDCKKAVPRDQSDEPPKDENKVRTKKLFVGGLPQTITEEQFRTYFEKFGKIEDSVIMLDKDTGKSRGFGFVTFASEDAVELVMSQVYENIIAGKWVECKRAQSRDQIAASTKRSSSKPARDQSIDVYSVVTLEK